MSTAVQWAEALGSTGGGPFTLRFDRLGLEAQCRPLNAGEVEECVRMGGQRGLRYALYLACGELREAGETLRKQGAVASAFDITEKLSYGDVLAAGAAILSRSGADTAAVALEGSEGQGWEQAALPAGAFTDGQTTSAEGVAADSLLSGVYPLAEAAAAGGLDVRELADRLWAAAGNR